MSRRAHHQVSSAKIGAILIAVAVLGLAGYWSYRFLGGAYRTTEVLDPAIYYENANSLRGNTYVVEGNVGNSLGWNPDKGRLFSLVTRNNNRDWILPIFVPHNLQTLNIQKNQKYVVKAKVNDQGILSVVEMAKP